MGALYGFEIVVARSGVRAALEAIIRRADPVGYRGCRVVFEDGSFVDAPFDGEAEEGPIDVWPLSPGSEWRCLSGSLWLPVDDVVRRYLAGSPRTRSRTGPHGEEASFGNVSIHICLGHAHAVVDVSAVTSSMSYTFDASDAVRSTVGAIVAECRGALAVLSRELGEPVEALDRSRTARVDPHNPEDQDSVEQWCLGTIAALS